MVAIIPHTAQLIKLSATDPDPSATPFGEINIPEPIENINIHNKGKGHVVKSL